MPCAADDVAQAVASPLPGSVPARVLLPAAAAADQTPSGVLPLGALLSGRAPAPALSVLLLQETSLPGHGGLGGRWGVPAAQAAAVHGGPPRRRQMQGQPQDEGMYLFSAKN